MGKGTSWKEERLRQSEAPNQQALRLEAGVTRSVNKLPGNADSESPSVRQKHPPAHTSTPYASFFPNIPQYKEELGTMAHAHNEAHLLSVVGLEKSLSLRLSRTVREGTNSSELKQDEESSPFRGGL